MEFVKTGKEDIAMEDTDSGIFSSDYNSMESSDMSDGGHMSKHSMHNTAGTDHKASVPRNQMRGSPHKTAESADSVDSCYGSLPSEDHSTSASMSSSGNNSLRSSDGGSLDSGLGDSIPSELPSNSSPATTALLSQPEQTNIASSRTQSSPDFYNGTPEGFLQDFLISEWLKWDSVRDIRERLDRRLLETIREIFWDQDEDRDFEAIHAAREGDERAVALAVFVAKTHKQLNTMNKNRQTILHLAARTCSAVLVRLIITRGADGAIADAWGDTALHIAAREGRPDVIKALTTTLTKPEVRHPYYRVPYKSLPQDNVQSHNHDGRAPVHLAAQTANSKKHRDALEALSKYARADMDYRRLGDGYAPSHIAIDNEDLECLKTCLALHADSEVRNFKSETPQQLAYLCNSKEMVDLCQEYGAGKYQLDYAETESVSDDENMDFECEDEEQAGQGLSTQLEQMLVS